MDDAVDYLFEALFALSDLRVLLRETAPLHKFNEQQLSQAREALARAKKALEELEEELQK
jgi:predicted  nucleic acid-binding Zn-ribbon protein